MTFVSYKSYGIVAVTVAFLTVGCIENPVVVPSAPSTAISASASPVKGGEEKVDSLAKGLALAFANAAIRERIRDALRDSPFRLHTIELRGYLNGTDGAIVAANAAAAIGVSADTYKALAASAPNLELVMPRALDRIEWAGGPDIDITATVSPLSQRLQERRFSQRGYSGRQGIETSVTTLQYSQRPFIMIRPSDLVFPADPEAVRLAAPAHARNTISTPAEERAAMRRHGRDRVRAEAAAATQNGISFVGSMMMSDCDDPFAVQECPDDLGGASGFSIGGGGKVFPANMTQSYCYAPTSDSDNDQIDDGCEAAFASGLAPLLNIGALEQFPARQPYWSISRHPDRPLNIQIIYALAYLADDGYYVGVSGHQGDSEFIILEVTNVGGSKWGVLYATLSAHFGAEEGVAPQDQSGADTYYWDDLDYPQGPFPRIWSALGKHANYRNRAACESGNYYLDSCGGDYFGTQVFAPASRNVGNYYNLPAGVRSTATQLVDCTNWEGPTSMYGVSRTGQDCFWNLAKTNFSGWDPSEPGGATPYSRIFQIFSF